MSPDPMNPDPMSPDPMSTDPFDRIDPKMRERVSAWLDGEATPDEAREVLAWLEADPAAAREVEELRRVWDLLGRYRDEPVPEGFAEAVLSRTSGAASSAVSAPAAVSAEVPPRGILLRGGFPARRLAVAASVVLALGVGGVLAARGLRGPTNPSAPSAALEALPAEAVENLSALASLSDAEFEAILSSDPEELARLLEAQGSGG